HRSTPARGPTRYKRRSPSPGCRPWTGHSYSSGRRRQGNPHPSSSRHSFHSWIEFLIPVFGFTDVNNDGAVWFRKWVGPSNVGNEQPLIRLPAPRDPGRVSEDTDRSRNPVPPARDNSPLGVSAAATGHEPPGFPLRLDRCDRQALPVVEPHIADVGPVFSVHCLSHR